MKRRLFVILPLYILFFLILFTGIVPIFYWVLTGKSYIDLSFKIEK